eukprot:gnl/TRDRNA2_/TRDRNA2_85930_c0_seq1.p2 gnl/TRDRNA2_/TRDRNA2_85930_c0~~gnl/TRDRNA2_/TRDRNA2_85930_c0_seq1.p2  ORF type:complete len:177 (-),score=46.21 gnl/TRDRNA2_/TRDRNA2_85930_c0_seq1:156-686(-)
MSFAAGLNKLVKNKKSEQDERLQTAKKWFAFEDKLLDRSLETFKGRCTREAEQMKTSLEVSFEALTREIADFPKRIVTDNTFYVDTWGPDGASAEAWFYANRGTSQAFPPDEKVLFGELLAGMMPKFVERLQPLGFSTCGREAGTWKIFATWPLPEDSEPPAKKAKRAPRSDDSED